VRSALLIVAAAALAAGPATSPAATVPKQEHITLTLVKRSGTKVTHTGRATGPVGGRVRSTSRLQRRVVWRGKMIIATKSGTLRLTIDARAQSLARRSPFIGIATITGGTKRYAHARGFAPFKAVVNRSTWAVTIDTSGPFNY
jgi:hypothetical protein